MFFALSAPCEHVQEEAEQKAKEQKKKDEAAIAKRVAEEMGMGSVGQAQGIMLTAQRIKRKVVGEKVSVLHFRNVA